MSTNAHIRDTTSGDNTDTEFHPIEAPTALSPDEIDACDDVEDAGKGGETVRCYAVGRTNGVIDYGEGALSNSTGAAVLYMSADGSVSFERWFYTPEGEFGDIPRATDAPADAGQPARQAVYEKFTDVLDAHAEVEA